MKAKIKFGSEAQIGLDLTDYFCRFDILTKPKS